MYAVLSIVLTAHTHTAFMAPIKAELFASHGGITDSDVVEVGMGNGPNLEAFAQAGVRSVHGVEPNEAMHGRALAAARRAGMPAGALTLGTGVAERLPLADASVTVLVSTMLLCSVSDLERSVDEAARVLRPGGRWYFVEHVAASRDNVMLKSLQSAFDGAQSAVCHGCHLTRSPLGAIAAHPAFAPAPDGAGVTARRFTLGDRSEADGWSWPPQPPAAAASDSLRSDPSRASLYGQCVSGEGRGWSPEVHGAFPMPHFLLSPHVAGVAVKAA